MMPLVPGFSASDLAAFWRNKQNRKELDSIIGPAIVASDKNMAARRLIALELLEQVEIDPLIKSHEFLDSYLKMVDIESSSLRDIHMVSMMYSAFELSSGSYDPNPRTDWNLR